MVPSSETLGGWLRVGSTLPPARRAARIASVRAQASSAARRRPGSNAGRAAALEARVAPSRTPRLSLDALPSDAATASDGCPFSGADAASAGSARRRAREAARSAIIGTATTFFRVELRHLLVRPKRAAHQLDDDAVASRRDALVARRYAPDDDPVRVFPRTAESPGTAAGTAPVPPQTASATHGAVAARLRPNSVDGDVRPRRGFGRGHLRESGGETLHQPPIASSVRTPRRAPRSARR